MAREPDDIVVAILREIQATLADHTRMLKDHTAEFRSVHQEIADLKETTVTSGGLSLHANVKTESLQRQLDALADRVSRIEEKV